MDELNISNTISEENHEESHEENYEESHEENYEGKKSGLEELRERTEKQRQYCKKMNKMSEHTEKINELKFWFNQYINPEINHKYKGLMKHFGVPCDNFDDFDDQIEEAKNNFREDMHEAFPSNYYESKCDEDIKNIIINCFNLCVAGSTSNFLGLAEDSCRLNNFTGETIITLNYRQHIFVLYFRVEDIHDRASYQIRNYHFIKFTRDLFRENLAPNANKKAADNLRRERVMNEIHSNSSSLPKNKTHVVIFDPSIEGLFELGEDF